MATKLHQSKCATHGSFRGERVGTPFLLLKCSITHYGRRREPLPGQNALDCRIMRIPSHFSVVIPPDPCRSVPGAWTYRHQAVQALSVFLFYETTTVAKSIEHEYKLWKLTVVVWRHSVCCDDSLCCWCPARCTAGSTLRHSHHRNFHTNSFTRLILEQTSGVGYTSGLRQSSN